MRRLGKGGGDNEGEDQGGFGVDLDALAVGLDLAPADGLVRAGAGVAAVVFLGGVDVDGGVGAVAHEAGVGDVMLDQAGAEQDDASVLGVQGQGVDAADVVDDVDAQLARRRAEGVEEEHVAETAVRQGGAEDGDVVAVGPVVDRGRVVDLLAEPADELARRPDERVGAGPAGFLLVEQPVEDGHDPVFKGAVVVVWHVQVADPIDASLPQCGAGHAAERTQVRGRQTLDQVLLDAAGRRHDGRHATMLDEVANRLPQARGD